MVRRLASPWWGRVRRKGDLSWELSAIGIDLGKTVFRLVGMDANGNGSGTQTMFPHPVTDLHRQHKGRADRDGGVQRSALSGLALREQGHDVRLMAAQYVKPYVKTNKSDYIDVEAIAEAVQRP